jgi:hypothetical protein
MMVIARNRLVVTFAVQGFVKNLAAYAAFEPHEVSWLEFRERWVPGLTTDKVRVGGNWTGPRAIGSCLKRYCAI